MVMTGMRPNNKKISLYTYWIGRKQEASLTPAPIGVVLTFNPIITAKNNRQ